jgi:hypothetical protein
MLDAFRSEGELEQAISEVTPALFGTNRIYLNIKKKMGAKGHVNNIPDGYLIDLTSRKKPTLYVVEVELTKHAPLKHIAVQVLEFSLSFESEPQRVKANVRQAIDADPQARKKCEDYASANGFENLDYLLETMIYRSRYSALVIIDEVSSDLEAALMGQLKFPVEIVTLSRYSNKKGEHLYGFEPFLEGVPGTVDSGADAADGIPLDPSEVDTVVVPAREDGFLETFLGENCWYAVRVHSSMVPKLKYVSVYRKAPVSAITHVAPVDRVEQWKDTDKRIIYFSEPAHEIGPIKLVSKGGVKAPQSLRYTSLARLLAAKSLDEAF